MDHPSRKNGWIICQEQTYAKPADCSHFGNRLQVMHMGSHNASVSGGTCREEQSEGILTEIFGQVVQDPFKLADH
jgi:hypothetical protein